MEGLGSWAQVVTLGLAWGGLYALMASGLTMTYAVTRHINLAHGSFLTLAMYASLALFAGFKIDPYISIFISAPLMFGIGLLVFHFLLRRVIHAYPVLVFFMFIGVVYIVENTLVLIFKADYRSVPTFIDLSKVSLGPVIIRTPELVVFFASVAISLGLYWLLQNTDFGRTVRATAENPQVSALMGINVRRVQFLVFGLGFVLLAVAGPIAIPIQYIQPYMGLHFTLFAIMILLLGGMGNFLGALVAAFIIGVAESVSTYVFGTQAGAAIPFAIFAAVMLFRPYGLMGVKH